MSRATASLGALVRQLRQAAGLTRVQLAAETALPGDFIGQIEDGRRTARPWMLHRLLKSAAMARLPDKARALKIPFDSGCILVVDALALYHKTAATPRPARSQLCQYFAAVLTEELAALTSTVLKTALLEPGFSAPVKRLPEETTAPVVAFLDWCTDRGWLPSNPLRTNGAHAISKARAPLVGKR